MGDVQATLDERTIAFIRRQRLFFVATAPAGGNGHVNCSPKGLDTLRVLGPSTVAYLDFVGSGAETIAHLRENGRIVIMFCAFEGQPGIVRLHGRGDVVEPGDEGFESLIASFDPHPGVRAIIRLETTRVSHSCGFGVPLMRYEGERTQLTGWAQRKGPEGLAAYQRSHNLTSIDGLPALRLDGG